MAAALILELVFAAGVERFCAWTCGASALGRALGFDIGLPFEARGAAGTGLSCWAMERAAGAWGFEGRIFSASFIACTSIRCVAAGACWAFGNGVAFATAARGASRSSDGAIFSRSLRNAAIVG